MLINLNTRTQVIDEINMQYLAGAIHEAKGRKLDVITIFFSMAYSFSGKGYWLKAVSGPSFASALLAVVPYLTTDEIIVRPNVLVPIVMLVVWLIAYVMGKDTQSEPIAKEKGRRLSK